MITDSQLDSLLQNVVNYISAPETIDEDLLRSDAVELNDVFFEVNSKLSEIQRLLQRGLRDDALQLAGHEGALLETFERLDFPDLDLWGELLEAFELPKPPLLNYDAASNLNSAFSTVGNLDSLLRQHRLFALARAPLGDRIRILQALKAKDAENPIWAKDIVTYQSARLQQIPNELERAISGGDSMVIETLAKQLEPKNWSIAIPPKLLSQIKTTYAAQTQRMLRTEIASESEKLQTAYAEFDIEFGIQLSNRIRQLVDEAAIPANDRLLHDIEPALRWADEQLEDQQQELRVQRICGELEAALDDGADRQKLDRLYSSAQALGSRFPGVLRSRTSERIASIDLATRRQKILIYASLVTVLAFIAGGTGLWVKNQREESIAQKKEQQLLSLVNTEKYDEAEKLSLPLEITIAWPTLYLSFGQRSLLL